MKCLRPNFQHKLKKHRRLDQSNSTINLFFTKMYATAACIILNLESKKQKDFGFAQVFQIGNNIVVMIL